MKIFTKYLALSLSILMMLSVFFGCKKGENDADTTETKEKQNYEKLDNLPDDLDFDGTDVKIFYRYYGDITFDNRDMELEGQSAGNALQKAIYVRNSVVEDRLNINLVFEACSGNPDQKTYKSKIEALVLAQDSSMGIDIVYHHGADAANQANVGYFRDIYDLTYVDIDQPYWYGDQIRSVSFNEHENYLLIGELLTSNYANMSSIFFNKDMFNKLFAGNGKTYDDLYDMVEGGKWTYEAFYELVEQAYMDDGNSFKNIGDVFGSHYESSSGRTGGYYPYTSGIDFSKRDSNGFVQLNINQEKTIAYVEKLYSFVNENEGTIDMTPDEVQREFLGGNMLFYTYFLAHGASIQAEADFNYGVIPFPKFDETCDYRSVVLTGAGTYVVPTFVSDNRLDVVSATLEAMCSESSKSVTSEYYDVIIKTRQAGGERDAAMIELIRKSLKTDFTFWCGASIGRPNNVFKILVIDTNSKDFVSHWNMYGETYEGQLKTAIEVYKNARK